MYFKPVRFGEAFALCSSLSVVLAFVKDGVDVIRYVTFFPCSLTLKSLLCK